MYIRNMDDYKKHNQTQSQHLFSDKYNNINEQQTHKYQHQNQQSSLLDGPSNQNSFIYSNTHLLDDHPQGLTNDQPQQQENKSIDILDHSRKHVINNQNIPNIINTHMQTNKKSIIPLHLYSDSQQKQLSAFKQEDEPEEVKTYEQIKREKKQNWEKYLQTKRIQDKKKRLQRREKRQMRRQWSNFPSYKIRQLLLLAAVAFIASSIFTNLFPNFMSTSTDHVRLPYIFSHYRFNISDRVNDGKTKYEISFNMNYSQNDKIMGYGIQELGINKWVQVGTYLDYFNVQIKKTHKLFKVKYSKHFNEDLYLLEFNKKIIRGIESDISVSQLQQIANMDANVNQTENKNSRLGEKTKNRNQSNKRSIQQSVQQIRNQVNKSIQLRKYVTATYLNKFPALYNNTKEPINMDRAINITKQMSNHQLQKIQWEYFQRVYTISKLPQSQQPQICIFSQIQGKLNHSAYSRFFHSIQKQNYSNYKIIIIDDSPLQKISQTLVYHLKRKFRSVETQDKNKKAPNLNQQDKQSKALYQLNYRQDFLDKIKIIKNQQKIGVLTSYYFHIGKCGTSKIVAYIDVGDALISSQALKTIGKVYSNENVWMAYSKSLKNTQSSFDNKLTKSTQQNKLKQSVNTKYSKQYFSYKQGWSKNLSATALQYRRSQLEQISNLLTHRAQLISKLPIQQFIQYEYQVQRHKLHPRFLKVPRGVQHNKPLIYTLLQLCDNSHVRYLDDYLYFQANTSKFGDSTPVNSKDKDVCVDELVEVDRYKVKLKKQLKILQSLSTYQSYLGYEQIEKPILQNYKKRIDAYRSCLNKTNQEQSALTGSKK